jgi:hypothetical protein
MAEHRNRGPRPAFRACPPAMAQRTPRRSIGAAESRVHLVAQRERLLQPTGRRPTTRLSPCWPRDPIAPFTAVSIDAGDTFAPVLAASASLANGGSWISADVFVVRIRPSCHRRRRCRVAFRSMHDVTLCGVSYFVLAGGGAVRGPAGWRPRWSFTGRVIAAGGRTLSFIDLAGWTRAAGLSDCPVPKSCLSSGGAPSYLPRASEVGAPMAPSDDCCIGVSPARSVFVNRCGRPQFLDTTSVAGGVRAKRDDGADWPEGFSPTWVTVAVRRL